MPADIGITDAETWLHFAGTCGLKGVGKQLVDNVAFAGYANGTLTLALDSGFDYLRSERTLGELRDAIASRYGVAPRLAFATAAEGETLKQRSHRQRDEQQNVAEETCSSMRNEWPCRRAHLWPSGTCGRRCAASTVKTLKMSMRRFLERGGARHLHRCRAHGTA